MGFMNARRLALAAVVSLLSLIVSALLAAPAVFAEELCPNAASRQGPSATLPDCRAYEQVTPADKGDSQDLFPSKGLENLGSATPDTGYAAEDGERLLLNTAASFAGGDAYTSTYVFSRSADGWTTTAVSPGPGVHEVEANVFDPADLSAVGIEDLQFNHLPGEPENRVLANTIGPPGGPYTTIDSRPSASVEANLMVGASADLSHVLIESPDHELAPGDSGQDAGNALYEWFDGQLRLVNVATDGSLLSQCGASLGLGVTTPTTGRTTLGGTHDAVSSDGSKVFFTVPDPYGADVSGGSTTGCWNPSANPQENPPQVYMRVNGASTTEISAPDPGVVDPDGPQPALYVGASADGSKVFFMSKAELTADDTTHAPELYEYDTEAPESERLTRISSGESGDAEGNVDFVGAISSDGSTVYFTAFGKLAEGASALSEDANQEAAGLVERGGGVNLYRYDTATRKTTYIAEINGGDYPLAGGEDFARWYIGSGAFSGSGRASELALKAQASWYTTANGQYLLFGSSVPLTGYDNTHAPSVKECEHIEGQTGPVPRCVELFRYSAADNSIVCVSCAGGAPVDNARFDRNVLETPAAAPLRAISEDGSYVFFETLNALVPQTTDDTLHVYEWHDGKISLISSADDPANAYFLGASADGSNVFFGTHAQLVPQDTDVDGDVYDARIDGGFVTLTPSICTGTGCQGVPATPPIFATPASVTFEGVGNFSPGSEAPANVKPKAKVKPKVKPNAKALTRAQKLAQALKACGRDRSERRRSHCEASAKARYGRAARRSNNKVVRRGF
jgi:hypothetical protein